MDFILNFGHSTSKTLTLNCLVKIPSDYEVTEDRIISFIANPVIDMIPEFIKLQNAIDSLTPIDNYWKNKNILCIGDSLTAALQYQNTISSILHCNISNHCQGGLGILQLIDGVSSGLAPLSVNDVSNKDLIIFYAGYNNRGTADGEVGDLYKSDGTGERTIAGFMQYAINSIYEKLIEANNLKCKILIVTVDCAGKYNYINADGYQNYGGTEENPRTMETLANIQVDIAKYNRIAVLDLYHNSGINRNT